MDYKSYIAEKIAIEGVSREEIESCLAVPPANDLGDYTLPCFRFSKLLKKSPAAIAEELRAAIPTDGVLTEVTAVNGYLNFKIDRTGYAARLIETIRSQREAYGSSDEGAGRTICIDYSSINVAKPFHIGHLSTTVLGSALVKIYRFLGYRVVGINHLGDYGTQFGKLIVAYRRWSSPQAVEEGKLKELVRIYVKFHEEADKDPALNDEARAWFKKIEAGDAEANAIFSRFKEITLAEG